MMEQTLIKDQLKDTYNSQYVENPKLAEWRKLGGQEKAKRIKALTIKKKYSKVIEFGAGDGSILQELDNHNAFANLFALEISSSGKLKIEERHLKKLIEVKIFDGYKTEYPDNYFDLVYCSHVIEHVEFPRLVLREIKRIAKEHIFEIPLDYQPGVDNKLIHFLEYGHINIYSPSIFKFLLKSEGFIIEEEIYSNTSTEIIRFSWYNNSNIKKTVITELKLKCRSSFLKFQFFLFGKKKFNELKRNAYTCRTSASTESLEIF